MKSFQLTKKEELNDFVANQKHSQFLQSWEWGEFQEDAGKKVIRLGFTKDEKLFFAITFIKNNFPGGLSYFYSPRIGIKHLSNEQLDFVFKEIKKVAKQEKAVFFRFEPISELQVTSYKLRIIRTIDVQPSKTLILDIDKTEEEILKQMHQKTRYNIRLAAKKDLEIRVVENIDKYFDEFWQLMSQTEKRDGFRLHGKNYYQKMLKFDSRFIKLIVAFYKDKMLCANIVSFFGDMATYIHGASANENRNLMAPYALQWHSIKLAKEYGFKYYDFNGIDEQKWPGVTRFKKGFDGNEISYPGSFDMVFDNNKYLIYKMLRKIRRWINYCI